MTLNLVSFVTSRIFSLLPATLLNKKQLEYLCTFVYIHASGSVCVGAVNRGIAKLGDVNVCQDATGQ